MFKVSSKKFVNKKLFFVYCRGLHFPTYYKYASLKPTNFQCYWTIKLPSQLPDRSSPSRNFRKPSLIWHYSLFVNYYNYVPKFLSFKLIIRYSELKSFIIHFLLKLFIKEFNFKSKIISKINHKISEFSTRFLQTFEDFYELKSHITKRSKILIF